jgi:hypothetical protein
MSIAWVIGGSSVLNDATVSRSIAGGKNPDAQKVRAVENARLARPGRWRGSFLTGRTEVVDCGIHRQHGSSRRGIPFAKHSPVGFAEAAHRHGLE